MPAAGASWSNGCNTRFEIAEDRSRATIGGELLVEVANRTEAERCFNSGDSTLLELSVGQFVGSENSAPDINRRSHFVRL